jgi:thiosulfate dehydrogenase [quinone] large subunit
MADSRNAAIALRLLSIVMGGFMVLMAADKLAWFTDGGAFLSGRLHEWLEVARPAPRWYLENVAIPGVRAFSVLVPLGELATGVALLLGFRLRWAALVAMLMILNFHFASDILFRTSYLINGYGPPVIGALLALVIGGKKLPWTVG